MATQTTRARPAAGAPASPALPVITVGRFEEVSKLIEELVAEKADVFVAAQQNYRDLHRDRSSRPLRPEEAAQIAAGLAEQFSDVGPADAAATVQASGLRAYDEPQPAEVLLAAGLATAPAFMHVCRLVTALIELDRDTFADVCESERLRDVLEGRARELLDVSMEDARARAQAALEHFAGSAGVEPGKAMSLLTDTVWQALQLATSSLTSDGGLSSLIGSLASTDGPGETSSTSSATDERSS